MLSSRALSAHRNVHLMDARGLCVWGTSPERKGESEPTLNGSSALGWVRTGVIAWGNKLFFTFSLQTGYSNTNWGREEMAWVIPFGPFHPRGCGLMRFAGLTAVPLTAAWITARRGFNRCLC